MYDLIIIGAGPAGISASVYARSRGMNVLVIEKRKIGGLVNNISHITHYATVSENETGKEFAKKLEDQAKLYKVKFVYEEVVATSLKNKVKVVKTDKNEYSSKAVIIACGGEFKKLGIKGEKELEGKGVCHDSIVDANKYKDKNIYVVGGANGAIKEAVFLAKYAKKLTIIHFENKLSAVSEFTDQIANLDNVDVILNKHLTSINGTQNIESLELTDSNTLEKTIIEDKNSAVFIYVGINPNTKAYTDLNLATPFIKTNEKMETEIEGVYAIGDIRQKQVKQIATAVNDGAIAAVNAFAYCKK